MKLSLGILNKKEYNLGYKIEKYPYKIYFSWGSDNVIGKDFIFYLKDTKVFLSKRGTITITGRLWWFITVGTF